MSQVDVGRMFEAMRPQLERDEAEGRLAGITVADLADAVARPGAAEVIAQTMALEATSVQVGEPAPDFTLPRLPDPDGERHAKHTLSDHFGDRPVALVFGSYT